MPRPQLGVNIDHVATLRQARRGYLPDPVEAALIAESAGADSIVCHLREDRRHIQDADVRALKTRIRTRLNLEMSLAPEIVEQAIQITPHQATLVPERRAELTTEGGLDLLAHGARVRETLRCLTDAGIAVSVFIDPERAQIAQAQALGVAIVELHTGRYAEATTPAAAQRELRHLETAARYAHELGLRVNAGHGLDYTTTEAVAQLPCIEELNIGFAIIARAVVVGPEQAVREMAQLIHHASDQRLATSDQHGIGLRR